MKKGVSNWLFGLAITVFAGFVIYGRWSLYDSYTNYGEYTVGEVIKSTADGSNGVGYIYYRYLVNGKMYEDAQSSTLFIAEPDSGKFVVLYDGAKPFSSIIWLNYTCGSYDLGDNLSNLVDRNKVKLSLWAIDLVVVE